MAKINLLELEETGMVGSLEGQKVMLYGGNNLGKSFQSSKLPKPLLIMTEAGGNAVRCPKVSVNKWTVFKDLVKQLTDEKTLDQMKEKYTSICIDTLENLVSLCEQQTCLEYSVRDLSELTGKQNGYAIYRKDFKAQINKLCSAGYFVLFIDHEEVVEVEDPITGEVRNFVQPKGSGNIKSSTRFVRDMCDFVFYVFGGDIDENGDTIPSSLLCKQTKHAFARSRYAIQTYVKPFTAKGMEDAIIKAIEKSAEDENAILSNWKPDRSEYTKDDWVELIEPYFKTLIKRYPEWTRELVACKLGNDKRISQATDDDIVQLENIYNQFVTFANNMGVVVE